MNTKEHVIIKLFLSGLDEDYREIHLDDYDTILNEMRGYVHGCGRVLTFSAITGDFVEAFPVTQDCFAEVEYTGDLTEGERKEYINYLKRLSMNEKMIIGKFSDEYCLLKLVKFRKISDEIIAI